MAGMVRWTGGLSTPQLVTKEMQFVLGRDTWGWGAVGGGNSTCVLIDKLSAELKALYGVRRKHPPGAKALLLPAGAAAPLKVP